MRSALALTLTLLLASSAAAFDGRYEVEGVGPEGTYSGAAKIEARGGEWSVIFKTHDARGHERLGESSAHLRGSLLRFSVRATREGVAQRPLRVTLKQVEGSSRGLVATYQDSERRVVRRECWLPSERIRIPLQVVALTGSSGFPGVTAPQASEAQTWVLAQLNAVYGAMNVEFVPLTSRPVPVAGARYDTDADGQLTLEESRALRDGLEARTLKRRGRVVLVLTAASFAHGDCRGWTLGDSPASPGTLSDLNDNFSLVDVRYLDPNRFHTVAHEVGHQLGLDDLNAKNRRLLGSPRRDDHLMISGGNGLHLDPVTTDLLERTSQGFPDHGLEGRLKRGYAPPAANSDALPARLAADGLLPPAPALRPRVRAR